MSFGFLVGTYFGESFSPHVWCKDFVLFMNFGSGFFINSGTSNLIVQIICWLSPFRYAVEALLRTLLMEKEYGDRVLKQFNFDLGRENCKAAVALSAFLFFIFAWEGLEIDDESK